MPGVLFVCLANQFRSPLAASFLQEALNTPMGAGWRVASAGTWTTGGQSVHPEAAKFAARYKIDLGNHRSRPVTAELLEEFDWILVMERGQREALQVEFPEVADRIYLLTEVVTGVGYDVPDPIENREIDSVEVAEEIRRMILEGYEKILDLAENVP